MEPFQRISGSPRTRKNFRCPAVAPQRCPWRGSRRARGGGAAKAKFQCPACDYSHKYGSEVADHIEGEHPELGKQWFEILCPEGGCGWGVEWNLVCNDKESQEAKVLEHRETQHNPQSPRYDPWGMCGCKDCHQLSRCPKKKECQRV